MVHPLSNPLKFKILGSYELHYRLRRAVLWACLLGSPFFLGLIAGWVFGIRVNLTPSLPLGFYITSHSSNANLVEFCPQGKAAYISLIRQYRTAGACPDGGAPLLKPGVAFPGDDVEVSANGIRVNGQLLPNSAGRFRDHLQRPLDPWPNGTYKVEPGTVWVVSSFNSYSFDSRYYGAIPNSAIRHHLRPLWTFATEVPQQ
jgi:conjugative transfer signal peptidase TraF